MKNLLIKTANWKFIIPAFLCCVYCIYEFQQAQAEMSQIAGTSVTTIDVMEDYTLKDVNDLFGKLKAEGRAIHRHNSLVPDMIFPVSYGILFTLICVWFLIKITHPKSNWLYLALVPVVLILLDFKENVNTINLLDSYPNLTAEMVNSASRITKIKTDLVGLTMLLPVILGLIWVVKWGVSKLGKSTL
ncbi:MAG: hypothetical protein AAGF89_16020 [Bacteroidota bacterium]